MLSMKYIAGFLDADGSVGIAWRAGIYSPQLVVSFSQKETQDKPLHLIHKEFGGSLHVDTIKGSRYTHLAFRAGPAMKLLSRIKKHLVIKRRYSDVCLEMVKNGKPSNLEDAKLKLKNERKIKSLPLPNFPPRKWLAGYFDGDGCIFSVIQKKGSAQITCSIASSWFDTEGIEIIQKSFGGFIRIMSKGNMVHQLFIGIPPSKAKQFFGYFAKHLIIKKEQAEFVLSCAEMGHYRDGRNINSALKQLKTHPHRLSEPEVETENLIGMVHDKKWGRHGNVGESCTSCGRNDVPYYAKGMCSKCYHTQLRSAA